MPFVCVDRELDALGVLLRLRDARVVHLADLDRVARRC